MTEKPRQAKPKPRNSENQQYKLAIESEKPISVVAKELDVIINTLHN